MFGGNRKKERQQQNLNVIWDSLVGSRGVLPNFDDSKPVEYSADWLDKVARVHALLDGADIPKAHARNYATSFWVYAMRWLQQAATRDDDRYLSSEEGKKRVAAILESFHAFCKRSGGELMDDVSVIQSYLR